MVLAPSPAPSVRDRAFLLDLQRQALRYFLDNQTADGLVLDRQSNFGPRRRGGLCSLTATGMGFIAVALANAPLFRLLSAGAAARRVAAGLRIALGRLPHDHGVLPHFVDSDTFEVCGADICSTVETGWLAVGALWAAAFLRDPVLTALADCLYGRIDWRRWAAPNGLLRHGKEADGRPIRCTWDRLNGETAFLYVLAVGAEEGRRRRLPAGRPCGRLRARRAGFASARRPGPVRLPVRPRSAGPPQPADAGRPRPLGRGRPGRRGQPCLPRRRGSLPNLPALLGPVGRRRPRRSAAPRFLPRLRPVRPPRRHRPPDRRGRIRRARTGDGPRKPLPGRRDRSLTVRGRYGFSNVNLDRNWVGRDMVGIDAGALVLALDNFLAGDRVRAVFHDLPCVAAGCERLGFAPRPVPVRRAS